MREVSQDWFEYMASMFWQSSLVIAVVLAIYWLLRKRSAALRYFILCLILVKFLIPPHFGMTISGRNVVMEVIPPKKVIPQNAEELPTSLDRLREGTPENISEKNGEEKTRGEHFRALIASMGAALREYWQEVLFLLWLMVVTLLLSLSAVQTLRTWSYLRRAKPVSGRFSNHFTLCLRQVRYALPVKLRIHPELPSPILWGLWRPKIILPESVLTYPERQLRAIIFHELAHVLRRDLQVNLLQTFLQIIWFFHPGIWIANWLIYRERERACDDFVLTKMNVSGKEREYAQGIISVLQNWNRSFMPSMGALGVAERGGDIRERIQRILNPNRSIQAQAGMVGVWLALLLGMVLLPLEGAKRVVQMPEYQEMSFALRLQTKDNDFVEEDAKIKIILRGLNSMSESAVGYHINDRGKGRSEISYEDVYSLSAERKLAQATVHVDVEGFTFQKIGPIYPDEKGDLGTINARLIKSDPATVVVQNTEGHRIPAGMVDFYYAFDESWEYHGHGQRTVSIDESGRAVLENYAGLPVNIHVRAPGHQDKVWSQVSLDTDKPLVCTLERSHSVVGRVIDAMSQKPVEGVKVKLYEQDLHLRRSHTSVRHSIEDEQRLLAISNRNGEFTLDSLNDEDDYIIYLQKEGYQPDFSREITSRQRVVRMTLKPQIKARGKIIDAHTEKPIQNAKVYLRHVDYRPRQNYVSLSNQWFYPKEEEHLAITDASGEFTLSGLNERDEYRFRVVGKGYLRREFEEVFRDPASLLEWELKRVVPLSGKVIGLPKKYKRIAVTTYSNPKGETNYYCIRRKGGEAFFRIRNLSSQKVELIVGEYAREVNLVCPIKNLVINLNDPSTLKKLDSSDERLDGLK